MLTSSPSRGIKKPSGLNRSPCSLLLREKWHPLSSRQLTMRVYCVLWESAANVCQFISSRFAGRKTLLPLAQPTQTRGDYIFYLSLLGSIFPANSRLMCNGPREKPSQCTRESTTVIALCERADRAPPSLSGVTTRILFRPCRTICQYPGIYRPLILAGHRS